MDNKQLAFKEIAIRRIEQIHKNKHQSLISFIEYFFQEELHKTFTSNWHYKLITRELEELRN